MADERVDHLDTNFKTKTIQGILWHVTSRLGRLFFMFVINIILARLLSPREFGLVAMVSVITSFASIFAELGFTAALIQKQQITQKHLSSVFWLNIGVGSFFTILFMLGAPLVADFYGEPILTGLTILLATNFFISSLNIVQNTLLTKSLDFRKLSIVEIIATLISGIIAIIMAYYNFGVWSLAVQSVLLALITAILLWVLTDWYPKLIFDWSAIRDLLGFSLSLFGTNVFNYWVRNVDYLLIGRFLGTDALGIYNRSYDVMLLPLTSISRVFSKVMFPSLSVIQHDRQRVANIFLRITQTIALITFPMMSGLFVTSDFFVLAVFGDKWYRMIPVLQVLSIVGLVQSISTLYGNLYLSQGKANLQFKVGFVLRIFLVSGIAIGLYWGIVGVAIGYAIVTILNSYLNFFFAGQLINLTYWQLLKNLAGIFICTGLMVLTVWVARQLLPPGWNVWLNLSTLVLIGLIVYSLTIHIFQVSAYLELRQLIWQQIQPYFKTLMTKYVKP